MVWLTGFLLVNEIGMVIWHCLYSTATPVLGDLFPEKTPPMPQD
jgi:hypothetical protein